MSGDARAPAYLEDTVSGFLRRSVCDIVGQLARHSEFGAEQTQCDAWCVEVELLQQALRGVVGHLFLEFVVPRLGSRIDAVLVAGAAVVTIEFKVGASGFLRADQDQVWDYALDLKNFHRGSHDADIFPLLVATEAVDADSTWESPYEDGVRPPRRIGGAQLGDALRDAVNAAHGPHVDGAPWARHPYQPTPTIVQAARALYARHSVSEISRSDASARNLSETAEAIEAVIDRSRRDGRKALVLVTGVPGAGKTLVGLNVATRHRRSVEQDPAHAVFLSGNGPLVTVLREALTRDELQRLRERGVKFRRGDVAQQVKPFIQNVHHFRDEGLRSRVEPPADHVVVFDEAQRAWDRSKTARFMKSRKKINDFTQSEPEFQLSYMNRHGDWAVAVCLVGGGQEIHDGEAGIETWVDAVHDGFPEWDVYASPRLTDSEYGEGRALDALRRLDRVVWDERLHLAVSMRSFRAERLSGFVKALLDLDADAARRVFVELRDRYPLVVTRDLDAARRWIRRQARGTERYGLVASSQAERLKPHAIDVRAKIDPVHWFLGPREDTRSSFYLEDAATEFQVQGLELDWVCVTWDADLRLVRGEWNFRKFHGSRWKQVHKVEHRRYLCNAYRVLLTRARQGMAVFVPRGDPADPTRRPEFYDGTFDYLVSLGLPELGV
ncbi:MAG: DUF2075 domain-containing protein [Planctomycetes bacterium]|nr:DUF2075 domain-containing protein [Planctomycetota bacterium]